MAHLGEIMLDGLILGADLAIGGTFIAVFQKLHTTRSAAGMSLQTLQAMVSARVLHVLSHVMGLHYKPVVLPKDLFILLDCINACTGLFSLYVFIRYFNTTYEEEKDSFGIHFLDKLDRLPKTGLCKHRSVAAAFILYAVIATAAIAWYAVRPSPHAFSIGYFTCFYEALSAIALLPQLWMFNKDKRVPPLLATFVILIAIGRLLTLTFWWSYPYVYSGRKPANRSFQMSSEVLNLIIVSDFLYYWVKSKVLGHKEVVLGGPECFV